MDDHSSRDCPVSVRLVGRLYSLSVFGYGYAMRSRPCRSILLASFVFVGSLVYLVGRMTVGEGGADTPRFHIDEAHKAGEAYYYHLFFEQRDVEHSDWTQDFYARTNPPVGKYVFGAALAATGHAVRDHKLQHAFDEHWSNPEQLRKLVPDDVLRTTRRTSAVFGALICTAIFIMGYRTFGTAAGLIAVALLLGNPYFEKHTQQGLTDSILMFHLALIVPVGFWAAGVLRRHWQSIDPPTMGRWATIVAATVIVPGLAIALATASKLNGALTGFAYGGGLVLVSLQRPAATSLWRRLGLGLAVSLLAGILAVMLFVAINPYYHDHTFERLVQTFQTFRDWTLYQQISPGGGAFCLQQKVSVVGHFALRSPYLPLPTYLGTAGMWLTVLGFSSGLVALVGTSLGLSVKAVDQADATSHQRTTDARMLLAWIAVCVVGITVWLPLAWDRYLLPPYLAIALMTAVGLVVILHALPALLDALTGRLPRPATLRLLLGTATAVALWAPLALTDVVIVSLLVRNPDAWTDPDAIDAQGDSAIARHNVAALFWGLGSKKQAARELEKALELLDRRQADETATAVQRGCVLYDLARAYEGLHQPRKAAEALHEHLVILRQLRKQIGDTDDYVEGAFEAMIAERQSKLDQLIQGPSSK